MNSNAAAPTLIADVGGTNIRLALADPAREVPLLDDSVRRYRVAEFDSLAAAASSYLREVDTQPRRAVFAVAGPVVGDAVRITNHPWDISIVGTQRALGLDRLQVVNDFAAMAMSLPLLRPADVRVIGPQPASAMRASRTFAVLGPGTGLGVGALLMREDRPIVLETEGGHVSFAPVGEEEHAILRHLAARFGRVSNERLICGRGLSNIYEALCDIHGQASLPLRPEEVSDRAARGDDPACRRAVEVFCEVFGSIAGDAALMFGAWSGVYLSGGLIEPLWPWLHAGGFRRRFEDKGRFAQTLAQVPTMAVTHAQPGLLGAAGFAKLDRPLNA